MEDKIRFLYAGDVFEGYLQEIDNTIFVEGKGFFRLNGKEDNKEVKKEEGRNQVSWRPQRSEEKQKE